MNEDTQIAEPSAQELNDQLVAVAKESEERLQGWQRARADYQNLKRESDEKQMQLATGVRIHLLKEVLPLVDLLKQATEATPDPEHTTQWIEGVKKITAAWDALLKRWNVERVPGEQEPFDPAHHEAVEMQGQPDKVVKVLSNGYTIDEKLIMPARVIVGDDSNEKAKE